MKKNINYTYRYCTEKMIEDTMWENETSYPNVMEFIEYETFEVKAKNIEDADIEFLKYQSRYTQRNEKLFELEEYVEMDIEVENNEDRYIRHGLSQDRDTFYFKRDKNGLA